jgi:hypothetical protein
VPMEKRVSMTAARRRSRAKRAGESAAARPPVSQSVPYFLNQGRAWINGREVGGSDPRYAHLNHSYD